MTKSPTKPPKASLGDPTDRERANLAAATAWRLERLTTGGLGPTVAGSEKNGVVTLGPPHTDQQGWQAQLCQALGSPSFDFVDRVMKQLCCGPGVKTADDTVQAINEGLAFIAGSKPENEIETLLLLLAWTTLTVAMLQHHRTANAETLPQLEANGSLAVKMGNLFTRQIEALAKLRGGGKQQVEVRHVYINGNAVIGNVTAGAGGVDAANAHQAHATAVAYAPGEPVAPVWGQDAIGLAVQGASGEGEAPMPDARMRTGQRGAERTCKRPIHDGFADERDDRPETPDSPADNRDDGVAGRGLG